MIPASSGRGLVLIWRLYITVLERSTERGEHQGPVREGGQGPGPPPTLLRININFMLNYPGGCSTVIQEETLLKLIQF